MAPKHHPTPLSGGDRKALQKELTKARGMTVILGNRATQLRSEGEALIKKADDYACQSWNERMWSDGGPVEPSPTIGQAINGGYPWLEVECSRCKTIRSVDLAVIDRPPETPVHELESALRCQKCSRAKLRPRVELQQLAPRERIDRGIDPGKT